MIVTVESSFICKGWTVCSEFTLMRRHVLPVLKICWFCCNLQLKWHNRLHLHYLALHPLLLLQVFLMCHCQPSTLSVFLSAWSWLEEVCFGFTTDTLNRRRSREKSPWSIISHLLVEGNVCLPHPVLGHLEVWRRWQRVKQQETTGSCSPPVLMMMRRSVQGNPGAVVHLLSCCLISACISDIRRCCFVLMFSHVTSVQFLHIQQRF